MGGMVGSPVRNRAIIIGLAGVTLGVLLGIGITTFSVSAEERDTVATGPGRSAGGLVDPSLWEARLERDTVTAIAGVAFLVYMALVIWLIWRTDRRVRAVRPVCPGCGRRLHGLSERVASATGRCDECGGQVIT